MVALSKMKNFKFKGDFRKFADRVIDLKDDKAKIADRACSQKDISAFIASRVYFKTKDLDEGFSVEQADFRLSLDERLETVKKQIEYFYYHLKRDLNDCSFTADEACDFLNDIETSLNIQLMTDDDLSK